VLIADEERTFGTEHPDTLTTRHRLARAYHDAGRVSDAIAIFEAVVADRERLLGAEHPDTLTTRNNLADAYQAARRTANAALVLREAGPASS
jgi:hypothetical protein